MKKNILIGIAIFQFLSGTVIAGPFGLSMGMKKSDFKGELKEIAPYKYKISTVPKTHSAFEAYVVQIGPKSGLCYIKAVGKDIKTNTYGVEIKSQFNDIESKFKKAYGKNNRVDFLRKGSIWNEQKDWMPGLIKGERILAAIWSDEEGSTLKDDIKNIALAASATSRSNGYVSVDYSFTNYDACQVEIAATEDGAL